MPSFLIPEAHALPAPALLRRPKVDFDQNGQKSTLEELLRLGGLFPLARIQDRLPFSRYTLGAMAEAWKGEPSKWLIRAKVHNHRIIVLIHLDLFSEAFEAHIETGIDASDLGQITVMPDLEEGPEMEVLRDFFGCAQGLPAPA